VKPKDGEREKVDFEDIKNAFDAELEERARRTSDDEKRKEYLSALRNK
jgi:predicted RNA-binding protein with RPS1 domain